MFHNNRRTLLRHSRYSTTLVALATKWCVNTKECAETKWCVDTKKCVNTKWCAETK
jgi:hypothetical protein